jgi:hypothetical protein
MEWTIREERVAFDWHWLAESILGSGVIGFAWKSAKSSGRHEERFSKMEEAVKAQGDTLSEHTARLADGEGNFKVIDTKLDNIGKSQEEAREAQKEIRDLLIRHITEARQ